LKIKKAFEILIRNWPAKIMSIALAVLLFYFYKINTTEVRYINIPLNVTLNSGFIAAELHPTEVRVSLRGSEDNISLISEKDISAEADFSSWQKSGVYREPVKIKKSGNALYADPLEVRVEPGEIYLKIEEKIVKNLDVIPVIKGFPAENYELVSYTVTPDNISAEGPASLMEKVTILKTESISMDGRKESFMLPVRIDLNEDLINFIGGNEVQFRGKIEKALIIKNIAPVEIKIINNDMSMIYELEFHSGSIKIEAERGIVDSLDRENCSLNIDMKNVTIPGVYNLPVTASIGKVDGEVNVLGLAPETMRVYVTRNRRYQ